MSRRSAGFLVRVNLMSAGATVYLLSALILQLKGVDIHRLS